ncbi:hypothetical protein ACTMTI_51020 [Nonomuraea sp. H19]|uniref:hypothetical protein n=1 Tax=Nonomuraea sp. H19 TaxID=3452206 RepID=UPI003F88627D
MLPRGRRSEDIATTDHIRVTTEDLIAAGLLRRMRPDVAEAILPEVRQALTAKEWDRLGAADALYEQAEREGQSR